jgi:CspA family cold shock protein
MVETGKVVKWVTERGFGFIAPDFGGLDVFAHIRQLDGEEVPTVGMRVEFESA